MPSAVFNLYCHEVQGIQTADVISTGTRAVVLFWPLLCTRESMCSRGVENKYGNPRLRPSPDTTTVNIEGYIDTDLRIRCTAQDRHMRDWCAHKPRTWLRSCRAKSAWQMRLLILRSQPQKKPTFTDVTQYDLQNVKLLGGK